MNSTPAGRSIPEHAFGLPVEIQDPETGRYELRLVAEELLDPEKLLKRYTQDIEGNRRAARTKVGLQHASVYQDLTVEEIAEESPLAARAEQRARELQRVRNRIGDLARRPAPDEDFFILAKQLERTADCTAAPEKTEFVVTVTPSVRREAVWEAALYRSETIPTGRFKYQYSTALKLTCTTSAEHSGDHIEVKVDGVSSRAGYEMLDYADLGRMRPEDQPMWDAVERTLVEYGQHLLDHGGISDGFLESATLADRIQAKIRESYGRETAEAVATRPTPSTGTAATNGPDVS